MGEHSPVGNGQGSTNRAKIIKGQQNKKVVGGGPSWRALLLLLLALALVLGGGSLLWALLADGDLVADATPTPTAIQPTAIPAPPEEPTPTSTPKTPTPAGPGIDDQYQEGLAAYKREDWQAASAAFRTVYLDNPTYPGLVEVLGATYYNWGVNALNTADTSLDAQIEKAIERFNQALFFDAEHPLAQGRINLCERYKEGIAASEPGNRVTALRPVMEELQAEPAVFLPESPLLRDVVDQLFTAYVGQGDAAHAAGEKAVADREYQKARARYAEARAAYAEAGDLPVEETERDEVVAKIDTVDKLVAAVPSPTPTPRPARRFTVSAPSPNYSTDGNRGNRSSCVSGKVRDRNGRGVDAAVLEVNNGRGVTARTISGNGGQYEICFMGADSWSIALLFTPGSPPLFVKPPPSRTFSVNGEGNQRVGVNFTER